MRHMGLVSDVWKALFGPTIPEAQVAKAAQVMGEVFGAPAAATQARGLLAGVLPYGQPPKRGTMEMMLLYAASPWLRAVVSRIADRVAATEWEVLRVVNDNGKAMRSKQLQNVWGAGMRRKMLRGYRKTSAGGLKVEPVLDHPMLDFLRDGNPRLDGRGCQKTTSIHTLLKGDAYWLIERHEGGPLAGLPRHYWPIPPFWVAQTPTVTMPSYRVQFGGWAGRIPETEIVQFTDPDPFNPYQRGVGAAESLSDELDSDEYASKWMKARFFNHGVPGMLVSLKGGGADEAQRMKENWRQEFGGFMRQFRAYFTPREIQVESLEPKFEEMKLLELRSSMRDSVLEVFGYPKELLGILTNANRSTINTAEFRLEKYVVEPWREFMRHTLQHRLMHEWDDRAVLDYVSDVPADREFKLKVMKGRPYAFTNNQALELAGEDPTEEAWGEERPPTPTAAPAEPADAEVIPSARAADPVWARELAARRKAGQEHDDQGEPPNWRDDDIPSIVGAVDDDALVAELLPALTRALQDFAQQALESVAAGGDGSGAFDMSNPAVSDYLDTFAGETIEGIGDTTRAYLKQRLSAGYKNGESIDDIAASLAEDTNGAFGDARAELIARTEVVGGSNFGTLQGYKQSGVVTKKTWLATPGTKGSRESHESLDGTTIGIDDDFTDSSTGATGQHPGGFGDPASDCNCRCAVAAAIDETGGGNDGKSIGQQKSLGTHAHHEAARAKHEKALRAGVARALQVQRTAVVKKLKALGR